MLFVTNLSSQSFLSYKLGGETHECEAKISVISYMNNKDVGTILTVNRDGRAKIQLGVRESVTCDQAFFFRRSAKVARESAYTFELLRKKNT